MHGEGIKKQARIREKIADMDQRMAKLYFAYESEEIESEFFARRNEELKELKAEAQAELETSQESMKDSYIILDNSDMVTEHADELRNFLKNEAPTRARAWLKTSMKRFWIEPGWVTYEYSQPLPPGSPNAGLKSHKVPLEQTFRSTVRLVLQPQLVS